MCWSSSPWQQIVFVTWHTFHIRWNTLFTCGIFLHVTGTCKTSHVKTWISQYHTVSYVIILYIFYVFNCEIWCFAFLMRISHNLPMTNVFNLELFILNILLQFAHLFTFILILVFFSFVVCFCTICSVWFIRVLLLWRVNFSLGVIKVSM